MNTYNVSLHRQDKARVKQTKAWSLQGAKSNALGKLWTADLLIGATIFIEDKHFNCLSSGKIADDLSCKWDDDSSDT